MYLEGQGCKKIFLFVDRDNERGLNKRFNKTWSGPIFTTLNFLFLFWYSIYIQKDMKIFKFYLIEPYQKNITKIYLWQNQMSWIAWLFWHFSKIVFNQFIKPCFGFIKAQKGQICMNWTLISQLYIYSIFSQLIEALRVERGCSLYWQKTSHVHNSTQSRSKQPGRGGNSQIIFQKLINSGLTIF